MNDIRLLIDFGSTFTKVVAIDLAAEEVTIAFRFEQNADGSSSGFIDVPEYNVQGMRIYKASLVHGKLSLKALGAEYTGTLSGNTLSGTMTAMGQPGPFPVTVTKE